jgi:CRP/FNR family transcriptional regulator
MIPAEAFREWVRRYELWRDFYFDLVSQRLASVMGIVEEVAFRRLDARVASLLRGRAEKENPVRLTHQEIASELGSSREVISRILEDFSGRGLIRTERGAVEILDLGRLGSLSEG